MIIGVDVDDVVAALVPAWQARYNARFNDSITPENWSGWELTKLVKPECGAAIYDILKEPDLYDSVAPIDGALSGVEWLRRRGHEIVFVTSCGYDATTIAASAGAKLAWLQRYGFLPNDRTAVIHYVIASDKSRVVVDRLVDDRASTIEKWGVRGVLFDRPHNREYNGPAPRANGWHDVTEILR